MNAMQGRLAGWIAVLIFGALALAGAARAQGAEVDPPGRVARISELSGQVWVYSPDSGDWVSATRNQPLTTGDRLATEGGARAEMQIGSTSVRLDAASELSVVQLDDERVVLDLNGGSAIARVRDLSGAGQLELATSEGRFVVMQSGTYRLDRRNDRSDFTVYSGRARYEGPNSGLTLLPGQRAEFWIDSGGAAQYSTALPVNDAFASWSNDRDRRFLGSVAERYVSPEMTGAAELDAYGRWEQTPDYGSVWIPTAVAPDWAPYSQGRWSYVRPWGWTWVDDAPWGFAPFHYGRWVYVRNNWCWSPGTRVARPIYAPALVGWIGGGPRGGASVTISGGPAVGWFPLAPREVYVPSYRVSPGYARNLNITHVTNATVITNVFRNPQGPREFENRRHPAAITVVPSNIMVERRPVGPAAAQFRQAPWVRDLANDRERGPVLLAPSVVTPPARTGDLRDIRPAPGGRADGRDRVFGPDDRRGGFGPDRNDPDRDRRLPRERERGPDRGGVESNQRGPGLAGPSVSGAGLPEQPTQGFGRRAPGAGPVTEIPPAVSLPGAPIRPPSDGRQGRPPEDRDMNTAPGAAPRAPIAPAAPTIIQPIRPPPAPEPADRPTMRTFPAQRGEERRDERRDERRGDDRRPQRIEMPPQGQPQLPSAPRMERPPVQMPAPMPITPPRTIEAPRPVAPAAPTAFPAAPPPQRAEPAPDQQRPQRPGRGGESR